MTWSTGQLAPDDSFDRLIANLWYRQRIVRISWRRRYWSRLQAISRHEIETHVNDNFMPGVSHDDTGALPPLWSHPRFISRYRKPCAEISMKAKMATSFAIMPRIRIRDAPASHEHHSPDYGSRHFADSTSRKNTDANICYRANTSQIESCWAGWPYQISRERLIYLWWHCASYRAFSSIFKMPRQADGPERARLRRKSIRPTPIA